ncbi:MAG: hypothetical protein AABY11_02680, partial [archaeon]
MENEIQDQVNIDATQQAEKVEFVDHVTQFGMPRKAYEDAQRLSLEMNLTDEQFENLLGEIRQKYIYAKAQP